MRIPSLAYLPVILCTGCIGGEEPPANLDKKTGTNEVSHEPVETKREPASKNDVDLFLQSEGYKKITHKLEMMTDAEISAIETGDLSEVHHYLTALAPHIPNNLSLTENLGAKLEDGSLVDSRETPSKIEKAIKIFNAASFEDQMEIAAKVAKDIKYIQAQRASTGEPVRFQSPHPERTGEMIPKNDTDLRDLINKMNTRFKQAGGPSSLAHVPDDEDRELVLFFKELLEEIHFESRSEEEKMQIIDSLIEAIKDWHQPQQDDLLLKRS